MRKMRAGQKSILLAAGTVLSGIILWGCSNFPGETDSTPVTPVPESGLELTTYDLGPFVGGALSGIDLYGAGTGEDGKIYIAKNGEKLCASADDGTVCGFEFDTSGNPVVYGNVSDQQYLGVYADETLTENPLAMWKPFAMTRSENGFGYLRYYCVSNGTGTGSGFAAKSETGETFPTYLQVEADDERFNNAFCFIDYTDPEYDNNFVVGSALSGGIRVPAFYYYGGWSWSRHFPAAAGAGELFCAAQDSSSNLFFAGTGTVGGASVPCLWTSETTPIPFTGHAGYTPSFLLWNENGCYMLANRGTEAADGDIALFYLPEGAADASGLKCFTIPEQGYAKKIVADGSTFYILGGTGGKAAVWKGEESLFQAGN